MHEIVVLAIIAAALAIANFKKIWPDPTQWQWHRIDLR
jgi:hypothetical protein